MKKIIIVLLILLVLVLGLFFYIKFYSTNKFQIIFLNVGQGDSTLIKFRNGEKMLVDCGPDRKILSKLGQYLPFYDRTIDILLITHPDLDHYGGCVDVLKRYQIKKIITNGEVKNSDPFFQVWQKMVVQEGVGNLIVSRPEELIIASTTFKFLSPDSSLSLEEKLKEGNNGSIVFQLQDLTVGKILFTGDMELALENALLTKYCPDFASSTLSCPTFQSNYLKVGHHGSDSSSGDEFLQAVNPSVSIISVGKNTFGHPSFRVLRHLERIGTTIWRTDEKNDIIIP